MTLHTLDQFLINFDRALRVVSGQAKASRENPAQNISSDHLSEKQQAHSAGLMRVNHVGEICAQALYDAQGRFSQTPAIRQQFSHSGIEEEDHLAWCAERIEELGGRLSLLNPVWYGGALAIGLAAGSMGDRWNLAFLAETERQVEEHLSGHLSQLSPADARTRAVVDQMRIEEGAHRSMAMALGSAEMPGPVRGVMRLFAKVMTTVAYRL